MAVLGAPVVLDGSYGEGGSALIRMALQMASITQQPMRIDGVRSGTKFPGLTLEDIAIIRALGKITSAETVGVANGSTSFSFLPTRQPQGLKGPIEVGAREGETAFANACVVLNTIVPVVARSGVYSETTMRGETYGLGALSYDYFANVTMKAHRQFGLHAFPDQVIAGFGRASQGELGLEVEPSQIQGSNFEDRGKHLATHALVTLSELPDQVGVRGVAHL